MAEEITGSDSLKGKEILEKMEGDETFIGSDQAVGLTPQSFSVPCGGVCAQSDLPVQGSVVSPEKSTAPSRTPPTQDGTSKKHDEKKGLGRTLWKATKSLLKISPKKPEKLALLADDTSETPTIPSATTASGPQSKRAKIPVRLTIDELPEGMETLMTEVASSCDSVFRDDSIASCDTGAHISRLPSLESSSEMEPVKDSPEEEAIFSSPLKPSEDKGSNGRPV